MGSVYRLVEDSRFPADIEVFDDSSEEKRREEADRHFKTGIQYPGVLNPKRELVLPRIGDVFSVQDRSGDSRPMSTINVLVGDIP